MRSFAYIFSRISSLEKDLGQLVLLGFMSPFVHLQPINVVVYNDPQWKSNLGASFALRCFQRLSTPNAATRPCPWRDNRCTGGSSNTVLSY